MLTLLGALLGLLGSLLPELVKFFNNKEDHKHEVAMATLQMEQMKLQGEIKLSEINAQADIAEMQALYASARPETTGFRFFDAIIQLYSSSVRPTVTYLFMGAYILYKYAVLQSYGQQGYSWMQAVTAIWNGEDFAIFSTIMGFWFGGRFMKYSIERLTAPKSVSTQFQIPIKK